MNTAHIHLLLNHFPSIGMIMGLGLFLVGLIRKSDELKQLSLLIFVLLSLIAMPTYMSGNVTDLAISYRADYNFDLVEAHQSLALTIVFEGMVIKGGILTRMLGYKCPCIYYFHALFATCICIGY
jgi:hypothetical protein